MAGYKVVQAVQGHAPKNRVTQQQIEIQVNTLVCWPKCRRRTAVVGSKHDRPLARMEQAGGRQVGFESEQLVEDIAIRGAMVSSVAGIARIARIARISGISDIAEVPEMLVDDLVVVQLADVLSAESVHVGAAELTDRLPRKSVNVFAPDKSHDLAGRRVHILRH